MDVAIKSSALLGGAIALWLIPMSVPIPRFLRLMSYTGAMACCTAAVRTSERWAETDAFQRKKRLLDQDLLNTSLALEQASQEQELQALYFPPTPSPLPLDNSDRTIAAAASPATATHPPEQTASDHVDELIALSREVGWLDVSIVKQRRKKFRQYLPEQIRAWFVEMQRQGIGQTRGDGNALKWTVNPDLSTDLPT